jgi:hypothetical protein
MAASARYLTTMRTAESAERARGLPEYTDHDADLRAVLASDVPR